MGALDGPEAAKLAVVNTLQLYLPAQLAAIATARPDTLNPPAPVGYYADWRYQLPQYPAIMVDVSAGRLTDDGSSVWHGMAHSLDVVAALQSNQIDTLATQGQRMLLAIQQTLGKRQRLDGSLADCVGVALGRYGKALREPQKGKGALFTLFVAWEVTVRTMELL
jgi:hypothetical protein